MSDDNSRMEREVKTAELMIDIFCHGQHGKRECLCPECRGLLEYVTRRLERYAPFGKISPDAQNVLCIAINLT
jgi:hypothetical protein